MMKLSDQTLEVLKNFSDINTNILVKPGSELSTISTMKNIICVETNTSINNSKKSQNHFLIPLQLLWSFSFLIDAV